MNWPCYLLVDVNHRDRAEHGGSEFDLRRVDTGEIVAVGTYGLFLGDDEGQVSTPGALWIVKHKARDTNPTDKLTGHLPMIEYEGTEDHLLVLTPGGTWCVDCPATGGGHWTRTGEPPNVTATPSIHLSPGVGPPHEWHGFLTAGALVTC